MLQCHVVRHVVSDMGSGALAGVNTQPAKGTAEEAALRQEWLSKQKEPWNSVVVSCGSKSVRALSLDHLKTGALNDALFSMLSGKWDETCGECKEHKVFQDAHRKIMRTLGRGWVTPDHTCSWASLEGPGAGRLQLPKLNRGWVTPDPESPVKSSLEALKLASQEDQESFLRQITERRSSDPGPFASTPRSPVAGLCADIDDERHRSRGDSAVTQSTGLPESDRSTSPAETVIFIDWDDTLFPTSWLAERLKHVSWKDSASWQDRPELFPDDDTKLEQLDKAARAFVLSAATLGRIFCVTLAKKPWQETSMNLFMPRLARVWKDLGIETFYASQENISRGCDLERTGLPVSKCILDPAEEVEIIAQQRAQKKKCCMERCLTTFYGKNAAWKNVMGIGDGAPEWDALQEISFTHQNPICEGSDSKTSMTVKAIKMLDHPDCAVLCMQHEVIQSWLPKIAERSDDVFICLKDCEEDVLALHVQFSEE
eukprot:TRINITY_DN37219_c0_g1_i1.p1 TRINITY_DN37219_c0_g1~~TRINITY_DN37219_c0_g1_i1.p1  ORF type:complete len:485 (-),score=99.98 TRINITY_DN37219_c0_g1_i1:72-1526(-)